MQLPAITTRQIENLREQGRLGRPQWGDRETRIPVERYVSEPVWRKEIDALFRPLPLVAAHSSELAPGQVLAHDGYGVPILLARDSQGTVRAFLNVCRHRGMRLVEPAQASGQRTSVVCPYHGWTYGLDGRLRHMLHAEAFDACPAGMRDLAQLPCVEAHGLIWVVPGGHGEIDVDEFLAGLGTELPFYEID